MKGLLFVIRKLEDLGAALGALALVLMFALGLAEILARSVFGASIPVSLEYTGYLVAFSFLAGGGWTLREGKHIRTSLIAFSGARARTFEMLVTWVALVIALMLAFGLVSWALGSFARGEVSYFPSATPLWIPQAILATGPLILALSLLGRLIRMILREPRP